MKMINLCLFTVTLFFLSHCVSQELSLEEGCGKYPGNDDRNILISLKSRKNETGQWFDTIVARVESPFSSEPVQLDVMHKVSECHGKRVLYVKGTTKDTSVEEARSRIKFHLRSGENLAISNNGYTAERITVVDPLKAAAFTNRPLRDNEIFEVRIDKKVAKWRGGIGIGVTTVSPADIEILPEMYKSPNVWMHHNTNIYRNGKSVRTYSARDINILAVGITLKYVPVGETVGVMRTEFGVLHFFLNGADQGHAASNVPQIVYGVIDLRDDDVRATIVHKNNSSH